MKPPGLLSPCNLAGLFLKLSARNFHCSRVVAALRYGLRPEDYKPYHPTERPTGDYPDLGVITYDHKDPYENWSHDKHRRNWAEPVNWDWDKYRPDRKTFTGLEREIHEGGNPLKLWATFLLMSGTICLFGYLMLSDTLFKDAWINVQLVKPTMPKHYPYDFYRAWPFEDPRKGNSKNHAFVLNQTGKLGIKL